MLGHGTERSRKPISPRCRFVVVPAVLMASALLGCGGQQDSPGGAGGSSAKPSSSAARAAKTVVPAPREPLKSLGDLKGISPPSLRERSCGRFQVTSEARFAAGKRKAETTLRRPNQTQEERRQADRELREIEGVRGLAVSSCSDEVDDGVVITRFTRAQYAQAFVHRRYTSFYDRLYDEPDKPWDDLPAPAALGEDSQCHSRSDTVTIGDGSTTALRHICFAALGSYVLQVSGVRRGASDGVTRDLDVLEHTVAIKEWLANGAK